MHPSSDDTARSEPREAVVVVHGILVGPWIMRRLVRRLAQAGYRAINWGYPSVLYSNDDHGRRLLATLAELDADPRIQRIHLVTHSMGGIVARSALRHGRPAKLGRIVMLTPPNRGSWVGTLFGPLVRPLGWKTLGELSLWSQSYVNRLPALENVELGVIAGNFDYLVSVSCTHVAGQCDHLVVRSIHSTPVFRRDIFDQIVAFLERGRFLRPGEAPVETLVTASTPE